MRKDDHVRALIGAIVAPVLLLVMAGCGSDSGQTPASNAPAEVATVKVADSDLGPILVDGAGRTLYAFTKDKNQSSNCGDACIAVWPALTTAKTAVAGEGAKTELIGQTQSTQGQQQVTFGQWPLYYYVGDMVAGDVNGQTIDDEWFVVAPDGTLVKKAAA
jgi:predicted lipoprotein with Yx(FWY)xxD motif